MKIIFYIFIFIFIIIILSCSSPVANPLSTTRVGTYKGTQSTLQRRVLHLYVEGDGGFRMAYADTNAPTNAINTNNDFLVNATNITGVDPYYSFQNSQGVGTLEFIGDNRVIVTFRKLIPDYYRIGETLCIKE
ncbi:hypothetical protein [Brachyspira catarrhinii]|uniref:Uncharacterized protein n=1 Tax=Brachyspira catarrhinii TaxID=2528966 RepID=A0ABY2TT47_9SPIR|nr:hypothetical protein [Brachyspira catarrhinii]TKZ35980.1 hypothetical protein EZH24_02450 [Brachyspira catarrhinii]